MGTFYVLIAFVLGAAVGGVLLYFLLKSKSEGAIAGALERNAGLERSNAELKSEINVCAIKQMKPMLPCPLQAMKSRI
jgi:hypothetical protein